MVEQADACERHCDVVLVAGIDYVIVTDGAARLRNVLYAAAVCALNVVAEREECVRAEGNAVQGFQPSRFFLAGDRFRLNGEELFPNTVCKNVHIIIRNINVDGVVSVRTADVGFKGKAEHLRVLAQEPNIRFVAGKTCAVNSGLLPGADTDCLTVFYITDGVGLGIFQCDK